MGRSLGYHSSGIMLAIALAGFAGCTGDVGDPDAAGTGGGGVTLPDGTESASLLPARIRRLTNAEYAASARALTGTTTNPSEGFAPDSRQDGFTVNDAQRVDPVLAKQLAAAAEALAAEVKGKAAELAPCADPGTQAESCARAFITSFGGRAYRRPLDAAEADALLAVYQVGAKGATYADGIELVARAVLQSPGFLYLTEIGDGSGGDALALTPHELASSLSYLITAGPPDDALMEAAVAGALSTPEGREAEVRRLLQTSAARERIVRVVREWLGVDRIAMTAKDSNVYGDFAGARASMERETEDFVTEVLMNSTGTVGELLGADWSIIDQPLMSVYGAAGTGRVSFSDRRGILNQGAFLSVYAHATETAPVLRGVTVLRRVACVDIPSPTELNINVVPPVPDPSKTTRQRFEIHSTDAECKGCHNSIDPIGFSFERFDGMGKVREKDNGTDVDSAVTVAISADFDGAYADSNALAQALSTSPTVRSCFARNVFRASVGRSGKAAAESEESFLKAWQAVPEAEQGKLVETLITYVKSSLFSHRRPQ
ncbi:DUF1592 domain-containing protein [Sorangium atrum]|uniref:DUF1592 domain-containing protein n=1 Tax=Sorangium atrum TaxID=2995308 RepID=A0ABT5C6X2_9BACT|nr:DUF1592 domain-containing protein [Sorangium aterium]MDC0681580.1 DUF1592 domain-containing protein [Sorangium aterium]